MNEAQYRNARKIKFRMIIDKREFIIDLLIGDNPSLEEYEKVLDAARKGMQRAIKKAFFNDKSN